jgi:hypothetical protein
VRPAKGWSAKSGNADTYEVAFDFINGKAGEAQAIWSVNLKTGSVKYVNEAAKLFSWTPNSPRKLHAGTRSFPAIDVPEFCRTQHLRP